MSGFRKTIRKVCGWALVVGGIIGLFLPILQGTLMIIAGAALLGWDLKPLRRLGETILERLPWRRTAERPGKR